MSYIKRSLYCKLVHPVYYWVWRFLERHLFHPQSSAFLEIKFCLSSSDRFLVIGFLSQLKYHFFKKHFPEPLNSVWFSCQMISWHSVGAFFMVIRIAIVCSTWSTDSLLRGRPFSPRAHENGHCLAPCRRLPLATLPLSSSFIRTHPPGLQEILRSHF